MLFAASPDLTNVTPAFKCGTAAAPTICYATDTKTDALFKSLQALVNKYSGRVGFSPVYVDGKLGPATVSALQRIATAMIADPMTAAVGVGLTPQVVTKETIARGAQSIQSLLTNGSNILQLPSVPAPTVPTNTSPSPVVLPSPPPPSERKLWPYALGGAAILGVGYFMFRKPKGRKSGSRAHAAA